MRPSASAFLWEALRVRCTGRFVAFRAVFFAEVERAVFFVALRVLAGGHGIPVHPVRSRANQHASNDIAPSSPRRQDLVKAPRWLPLAIDRLLVNCAHARTESTLMGIAYCRDEARGLSVSVWDGEVTVDQRQRHMTALASDPDWGTGGLLLTDLTGVSAASLPTAEKILDAASVFLAHLAPQARKAKWAMLADATFHLAQRFGAYIEEEVPRMIVFNDLDTASIWLGVGETELREIVDELRREIRSSDGSS